MSKGLASRLLNDPAGVPVLPETLERVLKAARDLNYRPHAGARGLKKAASGALAISIPDLTNPVYARIFRGAWDCALARDFVVLLVEDLADQADLIFARLIQAGRIDGLIVASAHSDHPILDSLRETTLPHVFLNRAVVGSNRNVVMDDRRASHAAVRHLHGLGHRRIGHIAGPQGLSTGRLRAEGFLEEAARLGLAEAPVIVNEFSERGGAAACRELLERHPRVSAIFGSLLSQTIGALHALWEAGVNVPDDMSVMTYDDLDVADFMRPALTRIRMPLEELGAAGVEALIGQITRGVTADVMIPTEPEVVPGASTRGVELLDEVKPV